MAKYRVLVTGGAGFIGSALVRYLVNAGADVLNIDALTYAGDLSTVAAVADRPNYSFRQADIRDASAMAAAFGAFRPGLLFHLAAESHVDRSIDGPAAFIDTNVVGTATLLDAALGYWKTLSGPDRDTFRFVHVSTDEVYGALGTEGCFTETSPHLPNSPYAASKSAADGLARAWNRTYGLPVLISNCSNNYGPWQHPEKLIPTVIAAGLSGRPIPVYGDGSNVRDWLHVDDHVRALIRIACQGEVGETYLIGGDAERSNLQTVQSICRALDRLAPDTGGDHARLISHVADRPGHDFRYAVDHGRLTAATGWQPEHDFDEGIAATVTWYLDNRDWWQSAESGRLGLGRTAQTGGGR
ncbi:MAG: dTDP-glucose 4,6-dehydratase [Rhodospirillales bacterium]